MTAVTVSNIVSTAYAIASTVLDVDWEQDSANAWIITVNNSAMWVHDLEGDGYLIEEHVELDHPDGASPISEHRVDTLEDVADAVASFVTFSGAQIIDEIRRG